MIVIGMLPSRTDSRQVRIFDASLQTTRHRFHRGSWAKQSSRFVHVPSFNWMMLSSLGVPERRLNTASVPMLYRHKLYGTYYFQRSLVLVLGFRSLSFAENGARRLNHTYIFHAYERRNFSVLSTSTLLQPLSLSQLWFLENAYMLTQKVRQPARCQLTKQIFP